MLSINYVGATYATVQNVADLKGGNVFKVRQIYDHLNMLNGTDKVFVSVGEEEEFYQFNIFLKKTIIGTVYYLPDQKRIDVWGMNQDVILQIHGSKVVYKSYQPIFTVFGLDKCFEKLKSFI